MPRKLPKKCWVSSFSQISEQIWAKTVRNNPGKLYTGGKPIGRPFNSIGKKSKMADHSKWRQNSYFPPNLAVIWVRGIQFWQIIPFFAIANRAQYNGYTYFEIWTHQKFESVRVPPLRYDDSRKRPETFLCPTFEWNNWLFLKAYMHMNWKKATNLGLQFCPPLPHPPPGL